MALLSQDEEYNRARDGAPFSNGFEGDSWMALWCEDGCVQEPTCPLIVVSMLNKTPAPWQDREPGGLNRYTCTEYFDGEANEV